jgi:glycosyltransferase involved in cell wall biosynthesis
MTWFLEEVYPRVQAGAPGVRLIITGDHADLPLPPADNVTLTGFVDDVRPLVAAAAVSLVPVRVGGGTRLKILETMALHTPVVATAKGAEGLDVRHGDHLLIADAPEDFAEAVLRMLGDPALRQRLIENGYHLVRERYNWAAVMPQFLGLIERVASA